MSESDDAIRGLVEFARIHSKKHDNVMAINKEIAGLRDRWKELQQRYEDAVVEEQYSLQRALDAAQTAVSVISLNELSKSILERLDSIEKMLRERDE